MVIELKLQNLSKKQVADLNRIFLEAKWLYNWILEDLQNHLKLDAGKVTEVQVKDAYETRRLILPEVTPLETRAAVRTVGSNPYVRISSVYEGGSRSSLEGGGGGHTVQIS